MSLPLAQTRLCVDSARRQLRCLTTMAKNSTPMPQPSQQICAEHDAGLTHPTALDRDPEVMASRFERMGLPRAEFMQQLEQARQAYAGVASGTLLSAEGLESGEPSP
jgi:hypothetical protein